ncbi:MAG: hypothetical protein ABSD74_11190 [Rhizomicrobium sp.]|jgi:hypothetical protein
MGHLDPKDRIADFNARAEAEAWPVRCDDVCAFETRELMSVLELWRAKAESGRLPSRDAFGLRSLKSSAQNVTIVQRVLEGGQQRFRMRLVGSGVTRIFGESTGRYLDELVPPLLLPSWLAGYDLVLSQSGPLRFESWFRIPGADMFRGESFCAPVCGPDGEPDMVLGASNFTLKDGTAPRLR